MRTPLATIWITSLVIAVWSPASRGQNEPNSPLPSSSAESSRATLNSPLDLPLPTAVPLTNDTALKTRQPPSNIRLSPWTKEIVKLAEARIGDDVLYSFIDNSGTFSLGADQIVYLSDLGVPSHIISAMLQHDQELISGVRPLTVASEPAWETALTPPVTVKIDSLPKPSSQPVLSASSASVTTGLAVTPEVNSAPEINQNAPEVQLAAAPSMKTHDLAAAKTIMPSSQRKPADKKKSIYPVRESQPVELTPPIIFIEGVERTPNTIIIVGFPKTEPPPP